MLVSSLRWGLEALTWAHSSAGSSSAFCAAGSVFDSHSLLRVFIIFTQWQFSFDQVKIYWLLYREKTSNQILKGVDTRSRYPVPIVALLSLELDGALLIRNKFDSRGRTTNVCMICNICSGSGTPDTWSMWLLGICYYFFGILSTSLKPRRIAYYKSE